jgi:hypothetical protein
VHVGQIKKGGKNGYIQDLVVCRKMFTGHHKEIPDPNKTQKSVQNIPCNISQSKNLTGNIIDPKDKRGANTKIIHPGGIYQYHLFHGKLPIPPGISSKVKDIIGKEKTEK